MEESKTFETGCCPRFNPEPWQEREVTFKDKLFLKDHVTSVFHIPLNFGKVMKRDMAIIEKAGATASEQLVISDENSLWGSDVYISVDKKIPDADIDKIPGIFLTKVFEGPYRDMNKYVKEMKAYVQSQGKELIKLLFYYVYCPKCAKAYAKNYIVLLAKI